MLSNKLHCLNYLIIPVFWLVVTVATKSIYGYGLIFIAVMIDALILIRKINWLHLAWFGILLIPALVAMFTSSYIFGNEKAQAGQPWLLSMSMSLRLFLLSITSFVFIYHMPKEKVIETLAQRRILPVKIAYSLLAVFNAFSYLGAEFQRIKLAYQMRFQKFTPSPLIIMPLLVAAARYAHSLSISMYTRGLNQERSYANRQPGFSGTDFSYWGINLLMVLMGLLIRSKIYG